MLDTQSWYGKPLLMMTVEEQKGLLEFVEQALREGRVIILGNKRCFICGTPIETEGINYELLGKGQIRIIINDCLECAGKYRPMYKTLGWGEKSAI